MNIILNLFPTELCDMIKNQFVFAIIHHGRTSLDYKTIGLFLSNLIGIYNGDSSMDQFMSRITSYQINDLDIPDSFETASNDEKFESLEGIQIVNIQNTRSEFNVTENSLTIESDKNVIVSNLLINENQIGVIMPVVYDDLDNLKEKVLSIFNMKNYEYTFIKGE